MLQLAFTIALTVGSILLFCYWFRYVCRMILVAATSQDYATQIVHAHQLSFQEAQLRLSHGATELDRLKGMLDRDYAVLVRLMQQAGNTQSGIERQMLAVHYRLTAAWYRISSTLSPSVARQALEEMSSVLAHFANCVGEAAASSAAA